MAQQQPSFDQKMQWKGSALLAPVPPTLVSCGSGEAANILTVAWTGILNTHPPMTYISVRPSRHSYSLIKQSGEFVINLPPAALCRAVDTCGVKSGSKINKWEACGLTPQPCEAVEAPMIAQCPVSLACKVTQKLSLGSHDMFMAQIVAVYADQSLLDEAGALCLDRADLLAYAHGQYYTLGKACGSFGFSVRKKKKHPASHAKQGGKGGKTASAYSKAYKKKK